MIKIILKLKGGLGNQLFSYAAARRLSIINQAELVIDKISGFKYDHRYKRQFLLDHFNIQARFANKYERFIAFNRIFRYFRIKLSQNKPFEKRKYLIQEKNDFDPRLLDLRINGTLNFEGYWQRELYFKDIEEIIRQDLEIIPPKDELNKSIAEIIQKSDAVCIHVRWFAPPYTKYASKNSKNIDKVYYDEAISMICHKINNPYFFIFSDFPDDTAKLLDLHKNNATFISHNQGDENSYADLWLMSLCKHFIIANSTFSWWGAWLSLNPDKIVIAPKKVKNEEGAWGFKGLIPEQWIIN